MKLLLGFFATPPNINLTNDDKCLQIDIPGADLTVGNKKANMLHLENIVKTYNSKFDHALVMSDLNPSDRQNYRSCEKVSSDEVLAILESNDDTYATFLYIKLLRYIIDAFINKATSIRDRLYFAWTIVFVCRLWKAWLNLEFKSSTQKIHEGSLPSESLQIPLFSNQSRESIFRSSRSLTGTQSTMVNFTVKEALSVETYNSLKKSNRVTDSATSKTFTDSDSDNGDNDDFNSNDDEDENQYGISMINDDDDMPDNILQSNRTDFSGMQIFDSIDQAHKNSYFEVEINNKKKFLHKQTACWYLTEGKGHLSSDRLSRMKQTSG
ncbi:unnamed protein product [Rotaria sp. Silwood1]|nr:unnamed protein product [Rotaria sp. Silwood1]CAF1636484.1 unnamed protein product [Rotaria sp. Silwood1]